MNDGNNEKMATSNHGGKKEGDQKNATRHEADFYAQTTDLVGRAKRGDPDAISDLYRLYEGRLKGAVKRKLGDKLRGRMETMDLVQSVWKDVLSDMQGFQYQGPDSFFRWLLTRIIRKIQDKGRYFAAGKRDQEKEKRFRVGERTGDAPEPPAADPSPSQVAITDEDLNRLMSLLDQLPDNQRQALVLRMKDQMEFDDIGKIMGRSPDAARKLYTRAMKRIGELMLREKGQTGKDKK